MLSWLGSSLSSSLASSTSPPSNQPPNPIGHRPAPSPAPPPGASARSAAPDRPPAPAPAPLIGSDAGAADTSTSLTHSRPGSSADEEDEHAAKRRKGLTGAALLTLSGALDAAIFTSALGYSAYQLWKHPPNHDDVDLALSRSKSVAGPVGGAANANPELPPPPYSAVTARPSPPTSRAESPALSPRKVRHTHTPRPRPAARHSSSGPPLPRTSDPAPTSVMPYDPFSSLNLLHRALPEFLPLDPDSSAATQPSGPDSADDDDAAAADAEMDAFAERLKGLIEAGRDALVSRPTFSTSPSQLARDEERPLPPPVSVPMSSWTGEGDSSAPSASGLSSAPSRHARRHSHIPRLDLGAPTVRPSPRKPPPTPSGPRLSSPMPSQIPRFDALQSASTAEALAFSPRRQHGRRESTSGAIPARSAGGTVPSGGRRGHASRSSWSGERGGMGVEGQGRSRSGGEVESVLERASVGAERGVGWWERPQ